jgi:hypothetical protein
MCKLRQLESQARFTHAWVSSDSGILTHEVFGIYLSNWDQMNLSLSLVSLWLKS